MAGANAAPAVVCKRDEDRYRSRRRDESPGYDRAGRDAKGASAKVSFEFDVKEAPLDGDLDLSLDIIDSTFPLVGVNHKLKLPLSGGGGNFTNSAPKVTLVNPKRLTKKRQYKLPIEITDQGGVKDLYVIVNSKKVFYKNYLREKNRKQVTLNLDLKLEKKINRIIVISRDDQNVDTKKALYVRYLGLK